MNEEIIKKIAYEQAKKFANKNYESGAPKVPPHAHNGIDNLRIQGQDIIYNSKGRINLLATPPSATGGDIVKVQTISNPTSIIFHGVASYPYGGSTTKKATISGRAELGKCYETTTTIGKNLLQDVTVIYSSSATLFTGTTAGVFTTTDTTVYASNNALATVDGTNATVLIDIISWSNTSITIRSQLGTDWRCTGYILIT